jgi:hypothetical protein
VSAFYQWIQSNKELLLTAVALGAVLSGLYALARRIAATVFFRREIEKRLNAERVILNRLRAEKEDLAREGANPDELRALVHRLESDLDRTQQALDTIHDRLAGSRD